jgi:signal transduction histidine kinase
MLNILKNAIEHGFQGKDRGTILLDAYREDGLIRIDIANNGNMIPPTVSESLLRRPLTSECNNGIGLFTAMERLRSFGSWLTFSSEPGLTTFSITLIEAQTRH